MRCRVRTEQVRPTSFPRETRTVRLIHPKLAGSVLIRRYAGRRNWELISAYRPDGRLEDPLKVMWEVGLGLDSFTSDYPKLIRLED